ncbi:VVA0879 family protein [Bradyrhizobium sp. SRS-191]|uniref:VVA0879 family protein n=1 Tax=Bradyrhizobium sp. SRS-191 TaxID=2962606 RepID=UPI0027B97327|nr:VVA0879 family protein [Bradyrhizobium sp. SRS-191]
MRSIPVAQFHDELKSQGVKSHMDFAFRCPICKTVQSARDLIAAGAGKSFDDVEGYLAFSCVGRWTGAGGHKKGDATGRGCDWTLGGLFRLHQLIVVTEDGKEHPRFEPASPEEARAHAAKFEEQAA